MSLFRARAGRIARATVVGAAVVVGAGLWTDVAIARRTAGKATKALTKQALFAKCAPATVLIVIPTSDGFNIGSGVIVDPAGLVATNAHVVESSPANVQVYMWNPSERSLDTNLATYVKNHTPVIGRIVKRGGKLDLALVRLPAMPTRYPTVELGDSDALQIGQDVVAIGNPHGLTWTFTSGTVSAIRKDAVQTETPINPGNSGGPLLDDHGRLVGINTFIRKESQGLGFAIPVNIVREFITKFGTSQEVDPPAAPAGPTLSKNPVPLAALAIGQDLDKLRQLSGRPKSRQVEVLLFRDIESAEALRQRMLRGELTVSQILPVMVERLQQMSQHNQLEPDGSDNQRSFQQQLEKTLEHLKQIFQVAR